MRAYDDAKAVSRANLEFYRAFETLHLQRMADVWLREPYVKCVHPGAEMLTGYDAVLHSWKEIFEHTERIKFSVHDIDVHVFGDVAWVTLTEAVETGFSRHERGTSVMATNVFERRAGRWYMVHHHASPLMRRISADLSGDGIPEGL